MEELKEMERTYKKLLSAGLLTLLLGFALLIFKPLGKASLYIGLVVFALAFIPLELAKRTARRMAVIAFRGG
ncbi:MULTISPECIES: hypothetical protein [Thermococcus]|uniref:Uncharacterized protein n=1 Tax=Thermococcus nautili TaxID=195522 RepID=W8P814_9EURY|nr:MULTISPECIES: hypothetical protein [Thermococcus]AHL23695.1 hypothetical protein BD01_2099 [Thermococcus nautili]NJE49245.1 hypothetical protein [Thermococcus sp. 9N3]CAI1492229.1 conserved protein of unknown function [Thermococcus nautili]